LRLWLCLRLGELSLQCLPQRRPGPIAVVERQRVYAVNAAAALLGLEPGMDLQRARGLSAQDTPQDTPQDTLQFLPRDSAAEQRALEALCCWAYGVTPHLYSWQGDSLLLEIGGSLRLFGGVDAVQRHCRRGLACRGFSAESGLAPSALGAWLLSYADSGDALDNTRPLEQRLAGLPLALLGQLHPALHGLQRSGIRHLGELLTLPVAALRKRCGEEAATLLQQLHSEQPPGREFEPPACFVDSYPLGYPVNDSAELAPALETLLESLQHYLRQRQLQTQCIEWHFIGLGDYREQLSLRASSDNNQPRDWLRLTRLKLEQQPFRDAVEIIQLRSETLEQACPASAQLFDDPGRREPPTRIIDVLSTRLGPQSVRQLLCRDGHLPEHSYRLTNARDGETAAPPTAAMAQRPFWLLSQPEPLREEGDAIHYWGSPLTLCYGPERIEDSWWSDPTSRDYFVASNAQGQRFWVFHERRQQRWYLQGIFP
jgi:protein ImuB